MAFIPVKSTQRPKLFIPTDRRLSVLYIEDEDINWEIAVESFAGYFAAIRARNAREAFKRLGESSYDIILMDIQLSGSDLSGLDVARILKGRYRRQIPSYAWGLKNVDTPIVFVTAYTARYKKNDILEAGGAALLSKPVNFTLLSIVMTSVFTQHEIAVSRAQRS